MHSPGRHLDELEAGQAGTGLRAGAVRLARTWQLVAAQAGQRERLQHRLGVLQLVADHQLGDHAVTEPELLEHVDGAGPDLGEVLACLRGSQEGQRRRGRRAASRTRRRRPSGRRAAAGARRSGEPATGPRTRRCARGPRPAGSSASSGRAQGPRRRPARRAPASARACRPKHRLKESVASIATPRPAAGRRRCCRSSPSAPCCS